MILKTFFHQLILICNKREKEEKIRWKLKRGVLIVTETKAGERKPKIERDIFFK